MNKQTFEKIDGVTELRELEETEGFDTEAGTTWIYPTNYTCRDYQYSIIQEALLKNTMVSLPTGLGKTFIAAVVMYNFYRWYPRGKIIFMAPTRPLVKQQVDACYNIMAIPKEVTAELTGTKLQESRKSIWNEKRVFFITPQVLQNDLNVSTDLGLKIKCLIIDEAHKAKGNHAYCEVIRKLKLQNKHFRVLALSATPGNSVADVLEVIKNLLIAHLEIRTDESPDVMPYVFERSLETVVVQLDDVLQRVRDDYLKVLETYTRILMQNNILTGNCSNLTKGKIFITMKSYQDRNQQNRDRNFSDIMKNLTICHTLYYAYELLLRHGLRSFLLFFRDRLEKSMLHQNALLQSIIRDVEKYMGPLMNIQTLPDGSITGIPESVKFGHPKFYKLRDITCDHFKQHNNNESRVIVFCEYRETVMEAYGILSLSQPLIKPRIFMGKSSITQKQQISVIRAFKDGDCNTLISTCIGEEGLDVGNVDLIICFDINNKSPIRMIQRMGRTGRKREGRVVILVTEGREQQTLKECLIQKQNINNHILHSTTLKNDMYKENPRMIPLNITPKCNKIFITVKQVTDLKLPQRKNKSVKDLFKTMSAENKDIFQNVDKFPLIEITDKLPIKETYWNKGKEILNSGKIENRISFANKIEKLRILQPTAIIGHSVNSKLLVSLLQKCDNKKFNLPITQTPILISQETKFRKPSCLPDVNNLKQTDIRNIFVKCAPVERNKILIDADGGGNIYESETNLKTDKVNYLSTQEADCNNNCKLCTNLFDCSQYYSTSHVDFNSSSWIEPDISIYNNMTCDNLLTFEKSLSVQPKLTKDKSNENTTPNKEINITETLDKNQNTDDISGLINSPFKPPRSIDTVLIKCNLFNSTLPNAQLTQLESVHNGNNNNTRNTNVLCSLNENEFNNAEFTQLPEINTTKTETNIEQDLNCSLSFFNISMLEEIFEDSFNEAVNEVSDSTIICTPEQKTPSPILSLFSQSRQIKSFSQFSDVLDNSNNDNLKINKPVEIDRSKIKPNLQKLLNHKEVQSKTCQDSYNANSITDFDDIIDTSCTSPILSSKRKKWNKNVKICSLKEATNDQKCKENLTLQHNKTEFLSSEKVNVTESAKNADLKNKDVLLDICDSSILDMFDDDPFEEYVKSKSKNNVDKIPVDSQRLSTTQTELVTKSSNDEKLDLEQHTIFDKNQRCENDIWNFCVDSDISLNYSNHSSKHHIEQLNSTPENGVNCINIDFANVKTSNHLITPTKIIDLTLHSDSPCKSPSLVKSQRINSQKWSTQKETEENKKLNNKTTGLLSLKNIDNVLGKKHSVSIHSHEIKNETKNLTKFDDHFEFTFNTKKVPLERSTEKIKMQHQISPILNKNYSETHGKFGETSGKVQFSDDDDEFDLQPKKNSWIFPKSKNSKQILTNNSNDRPSTSKLPNNKKNTKPNVGGCPYLHLEADVSICDSDDEEDSSNGDSFEKSFVDDNEDLANTTFMHAQYLQSVRAADANRGKFKIPKKPVSNINVYSQVDHYETENTYINDSFCVNTEDMGLFDDTYNMSELEIAELMLQEERKKRKVRRKRANDAFQIKRRRIIEINSDSD